MRKILAVFICMFMLTSSAFAQSLWFKEGANSGSWGIFSDHKAHDVGDIVTIVISERTSLQAQKSFTNEKEGSQNLGAGVGIFDFLKAASISGSDEFSASGAASDTNRVTGNVTVTVVEKEPNGNLIVEGKQSIWQNKDEHRITFRGVIREDDVTSANTVPSTKVANATVHFDGKGPLNAKQRQGILTQVFNFLF
ncbi:MAG: flagellar basal body L-ring protein FlgH [Selenomonadaceae bacterium]|nr:flagellar basal body L-ring protein FlgH [Selenomonadaceae bacterium]